MQLLYPKEEEIMYAIWEIGHPCVISDIVKAHPEIKRNTIKKVLLILEEKKYLVVDSIVKTATRTGRAYAPIITKKEYEQQKALIQDVIQSSKIQSGILNFCNLLACQNNVDPEVIDELEKIIDQIMTEDT